MALSVVLVTATGLFARSLANAERVDPGFDAERIAVIGTNLAQGGVAQDENGVVSERILARIAALPGVESAALTTRLPLANGGTTSTVVEGYDPPEGTNAVELNVAIVSGGYFDTMGIPLLDGREFSAADRADSPPVAVVNETAARLFFGGDAVGRRVRRQNQPDSWLEVVGVVADAKVVELTEPPTPQIFWPQAQFGAGAFFVVARAARDPAALLAALPRALREVRDSLSTTRIEPMAAQVTAALGAARMTTLLMGAFAGLALVLAALGIYAAVSFAVERRTHEIGIRLALGATKPRLIGMVVAGSIKLAAVGIGAGLALSVLGARGMESVLFGVAPLDVVSFGGAALVLLAAAGLAAFLPALRASRANPAGVLRGE
jgi:putative ABC transport system permease protein